MVRAWSGCPWGATSCVHRQDKVFVTEALVILLLEARGCPFAVVHDLLSLALRGVKRRGDRFLAVGVVARDVEEFASRARLATPESVNEGRARRAVLKC
jgi:hypothetical protein